MKFLKLRIFIGLFALFSIAGTSFAAAADVHDGERTKSFQLPPGCANLEVGANETVVFHAYALGLQIYRWSGTGWDLVGPLANLYEDDYFHVELGIHYAGPTWESKSGRGSKVAGRKIDECTPDPAAIPWLLLEGSSTTPMTGLFRKLTHIQRVNTAGGLKPSVAGVTVGEEKRVPYTAEYYFYRRSE